MQENAILILILTNHRKPGLLRFGVLQTYNMLCQKNFRNRPGFKGTHLSHEKSVSFDMRCALVLDRSLFRPSSIKETGYLQHAIQL